MVRFARFHNYNDGAFLGGIYKGERKQCKHCLCFAKGGGISPLMVVKWEGNILKLVFQYIY